MARKKKKKKKQAGGTAPGPQEESFNSPFAGLKLPPKKPKTIAPKKAEAKTHSKKSLPAPKASTRTNDDIDPLEAALFLNVMGNTPRIKHDKPKAPGPTPLEYARLEDNLVLAELESLVGQNQLWDIEQDEDGHYSARAPGVSKEIAKQLHKGEIPPNKSIDLHGMTRNEAHQEVRRVLMESRREGHRCLHVITGRGHGTADGHGVLKEALPSWLTKAPLNAHALALVTAPGHLGGLGAFLVLIRRQAKT